MKRAKVSIGIALALIIIAVILLASCSNKQEMVNVKTTPQIPTKQPGEVYLGELRIGKTKMVYDRKAIIEPLIIKDNSKAQNVPLDNLMDFLAQTRAKRDEMSRNVVRDFYEGKPYYTCGYYVEEIHNDAEERGIKAGIAILQMLDEEYHGINVFETTDKGLVYVDGSYFDDKIFYSIAIGQTFEVYGKHMKIEKVNVIWEGYTGR